MTPGNYGTPRSPAVAGMVGRKELLEARPELAPTWDAADELFTVRVTRSFWDRVDPNDPSDPLARQVLPAPEELGGPGLEDPVGDALRSPVPWVVHKYRDRALLLVTKRCHLYCRYCFRRTFHPDDALDPTPEALERAIQYVRSAGVREVILSGGDPLALRSSQLFAIIDQVQESVPRIRVHTRAPVTYPKRVDRALVEGLRARAPVWLVIHANHPRELSPEVDDALERLVDAGIPVLNQSVLLRGVNDDASTLVELFEALTQRRVRPYYLHHPDAVSGADHFAVSPERGLAIWGEVEASLGGLARPQYVVDPPDGAGKRPVAQWSEGRRPQEKTGR